MSSRPIASRRDLFKLKDSQPTERSVVHIASLLVHALPERVDAARAALAHIEGAELHATEHPAKFVVVLESASEGAIADCVNELHAAPGVLTVSIVSHLVEDADALNEEVG
jgi:nitrate reductase NapD